MDGMPYALEAYPVQHLPIVKAYADQLGFPGEIAKIWNMCRYCRVFTGKASRMRKRPVRR